MINIYSKVNSGQLLHTVYRMSDLQGSREDFTHNKEYLQGAVIRFDTGKTFLTHRHIHCNRQTNITQEAWVIITGSVLIKYYDLDDAYLEEATIFPGDCTITFAGGHGFEGMSDNTFVYEFKTGPYFGKDADKVIIEGK